jgi:hypothetical protein
MGWTNKQWEQNMGERRQGDKGKKGTKQRMKTDSFLSENKLYIC